MNTKKTILHVIDYMGRGGAEVMLVRLLKELTEYKHIVVTLNAKASFNKEEISCDEYFCLNMGSFVCGVMDKKNGFFEMFCSSGQKEWCLFFVFSVNFSMKSDLCFIKPNGHRLCWRATC